MYVAIFACYYNLKFRWVSELKFADSAKFGPINNSTWVLITSFQPPLAIYHVCESSWCTTMLKACIVMPITRHCIPVHPRNHSMYTRPFPRLSVGSGTNTSKAEINSSCGYYLNKYLSLQAVITYNGDLTEKFKYIVEMRKQQSKLWTSHSHWQSTASSLLHAVILHHFTLYWFICDTQGFLLNCG